MSAGNAIVHPFKLKNPSKNVLLAVRKLNNLGYTYMLNKLYTDKNINKTFIFATLLYLLILYINQWFAINSPDMERNQYPLYDRGFDILKPPISSKIPDIILIITIIYFYIRWYLTQKKLLIKFFFLIIILFTMRIFVFMGTETPTPRPRCIASYRGVPAPASAVNLATNKEAKQWDKFDFKWFFAETKNACVDNMFSGHAVHIVGIFLFTLMFSSYLSEKIIMGILMIVIMITLIWSRLHYTSDVIVATFLTVGYFFTLFYHRFL